MTIFYRAFIEPEFGNRDYISWTDTSLTDVIAYATHWARQERGYRRGRRPILWIAKWDSDDEAEPPFCSDKESFSILLRRPSTWCVAWADEEEETSPAKPRREPDHAPFWWDMKTPTPEDAWAAIVALCKGS